MANPFSSLFSEKTTNNTPQLAVGFLAEAMKLVEEENKKKLGQVAVQIVRDIGATKDQLVNQLRAIRKQEKTQKEQLAKFTRAVSYYAETGNFGPLAPFLYHQVRNCCAQLGVQQPTAKEQEVPADWVPQEELKLNDE